VKGVDPRPAGRRTGRSGRVFDRVLDALSEVDAGKPADLAVRHVESRARDLGASERRRLRETVFGVLRQRRRIRDALARAATVERRRIDDLEPPLYRRLEVLALRALETQSTDELDALDERVHRRFGKLLARVARSRPKGSGHDAIAYNLPDWLWTELVEGLGADGPSGAHAVARALIERAPTTVRVRDAAVGPVRAALESEGISAVPTRWSPVGLVLPTGADLRSSAVFRSGQIELQDEGSQLLGLAAAEAGRGGRVLDACAGAGGKTLQLVETAAAVVTVEPDAAKRAELERRLRRIGASAQVVDRELEAFSREAEGRFDVALIDAPCTGTGTLRRRPDLALRLTRDDLEREVARQKRLVAAAARCVKPGGRLLYATCSVLTAENEAVSDYALLEGPELTPAPVFIGELAERFGRGSRMRIGPGEVNAPTRPCEAPDAPLAGDDQPSDAGPDGFFIAAFTVGR